MTSWLGHAIGMPLILAGYLLAFLAEGLIRLGAWFANYEVIALDA